MSAALTDMRVVRGDAIAAAAVRALPWLPGAPSGPLVLGVVHSRCPAGRERILAPPLDRWRPFDVNGEPFLVELLGDPESFAAEVWPDEAARAEFLDRYAASAKGAKEGWVTIAVHVVTHAADAVVSFVNVRPRATA